MTKKHESVNKRLWAIKAIAISFSVISFCGILFLMSRACFAAPVGNPAGSVLLDGNYPTKLTFEAENIFGRKLTSEGSGKPKFTGRIFTGKFSLYLGRKLDIYGLVGTYDGKMKNFINETYSIDSKMDGIIGCGISYVLSEVEMLGGILRMGIDGKYRQCQAGIDKVKQYREKVEVTNTAYSFKEWQGSLGFSYQYKKFVPYAGMKYSDLNARIKFKQGNREFSETGLTSKQVIGVFYGADYLVSDNVSFNIEARAMDENAVNAGINVRF